MKSFFALLSLSFLLNFLNGPTNFTCTILDHTSGIAFAGAEVELSQSGALVARALTNEEGQIVLNLEAGIYDMKVNAPGYIRQEIREIQLIKDQKKQLQIKLHKATLDLSMVEVNTYHPRLHDQRPGAGAVRKDKESITMESEAYEDVAMSLDEVSVVGSRKESKLMAPPPPPPPPPPPAITEHVFMEESPASASATSKGKKRKLSGRGAKIAGPHKPKRQRAGQLTAGEWKDANNWTFWKKTMKDKTFRGMQDHWTFYPNNRFQISVVDHKDNALADCLVTLLDHSGKQIWQSRTDNRGHTQLWAGLYDNKTSGPYQVRISHPAMEQTFDVVSFEERVNYFKLPVACDAPNTLDIALVVDATGSMGDEINYIKAELKDMIHRVRKDHNALDINLGALFYRDKRDAYLTRMSDFSPNINTITDFINKQSAGGGGDYPEAVHTALDMAVEDMAWSERAVARLLFLVLDAPPHHDPAILRQLQNSIEAAARKGIKVIPIAASGVNKHTEFLMKFFALSTNGTYVFLTDHSGIGNSHIKPTAGTYNIETLNDLMVRLILENVEMEECEPGEIDFLPQNPNQQAPTFIDVVPGLDFDLNYYPNPANDYFFIELEEDLDEFWIFNTAGQELRHLTNIEAGRHRLAVGDFMGGAYILKFRSGDKTVAKQLVVVHPD